MLLFWYFGLQAMSLLKKGYSAFAAAIKATVILEVSMPEKFTFVPFLSHLSNMRLVHTPEQSASSLPSFPLPHHVFH